MSIITLCTLWWWTDIFLLQKAATDVQTKVQNEIDKGGTTIKDQIADSVKDSVTDAVESAGSSAASNFFGKGELPVGFPEYSIFS